MRKKEGGVRERKSDRKEGWELEYNAPVSVA